jgi:hypothetical protein
MAQYTTVLWIEMGSREHNGNEPSIAIRNDKLLNNSVTTSFSRSYCTMGLILVHAFKSVSRLVASHYKLMLCEVLLFRQANFSL